MVLYADDITCILSDLDEENLALRVQRFVDLLQNWFKRNSLAVNTKKSKIMIVKNRVIPTRVMEMFNNIQLGKRDC